MALAERTWRVQRRPPAGFLAKVPALGPAFAAALFNRGLRTQKAIASFLAPAYESGLNNPWYLRDMRRAVARVLKARSAREKVAIYGDYDADGVCATLLTSELFTLVGIDHAWYLPDREKEGYGLNCAAIERFHAAGVGLIVTVDCGSGDIPEVAFANQRHIDVVVLDHHEPHTTLPKAHAVVNPKRTSQRYPFRDLSATGVVFKFAAAILEKLGPAAGIPKHWLKWQLDLVALATIADRMPLLGENRVLVTFGLKVLAKTRRPGLRALMAVAGVRGPEVTTVDVGFALAPRINAAGRMDHANTALMLLMATEAGQAQTLAEKLNSQNTQRQAIVERIVSEVEAGIAEPRPAVVIARSRHWPKGILGLVASKITERFQVPSFLFQAGPKFSVASGRSLPGYDIIAGIKRGAKLLKDFGGHQYAAGFTVANGNYEKVISHLKRDAAAHAKPAAEALLIDAALAERDLTPRLFEDVMRMAPFGDANPLPLFLLADVPLVSRRLVGSKGNHLQCQFFFGSRHWQGIAFRCGDRYHAVNEGQRVDIVFEPLVNEWRGEKRCELRIIDMKPSMKMTNV